MIGDQCIRNPGSTCPYEESLCNTYCRGNRRSIHRGMRGNIRRRHFLIRLIL